MTRVEMSLDYTAGSGPKESPKPNYRAGPKVSVSYDGIGRAMARWDGTQDKHTCRGDNRDNGTNRRISRRAWRAWRVRVITLLQLDHRFQTVVPHKKIYFSCYYIFCEEEIEGLYFPGVSDCISKCF